jgi:hypothetical protein
LIEALEQNTTLEYLGLWANNLGAASANHLWEAVQKHPKLTEVDLRDNELEDNWVYRFASLRK